MFLVVLSVVKQDGMFMMVDRSHAELIQDVSSEEGGAAAKVPLSLTPILVNVLHLETGFRVRFHRSPIPSFCDVPSFSFC